MKKPLIVLFLATFLASLLGGCGYAFANEQALGETTSIAAAGVHPELEGLAVVATRVGYQTPETFLNFLAENGEFSARDQSVFSFFLDDPLGFAEEFGLLPVLFCVLLGGIALNLTPCILPLIPITLTLFRAGGGRSRRRGFALGTAYGLGIAGVYGLLGTAAVTTGSLFGTIQATWWFNLGIAAIFIFLGLAMFDVVHIDFTSLQGRASGKKGASSSYSTALALGAMAALLAGACVAPVVIAVLLLSATSGVSGLLLPFCLGLGMALPWPFAAAGVTFLPKPGPWMVSIKYGFGLVILFLALHYGYLGYQALRPGLPQQETAASLDGHPLVAASEKNVLGQLLKEAKAQGRPVILDFRADWCKNCVAMEKTTLPHPLVAAKLADYQFIAMDCKNLKEPDTRELMERLNIKGLPTLVLLEKVER